MDRIKKPAFFWQGVLICLPMLALTLVGLISLWRDHVNSQQEADDRARREATLAGRNIIAQFKPFPFPFIILPGDAPRFEENARPALFRIDCFGETSRFQGTNGEVGSLFALDNPAADQTYRFNTKESWGSLPLTKPLEDPVFRLTAGSSCARFCLLETNGALAYPPPMIETPQPVLDAASSQSAACDLYDRGLELIRQGNVQSAIDVFDGVATNHPRALSQSGLPLQVLARYQIATLRMAQSNSPLTSESLVTLAATAVLRPSILSAPVLEQIQSWAAKSGISASDQQAIDGWQKVWAAHQGVREIWRAFRNSGATNWVETAGTSWIVSTAKTPAVGYQVLMARPFEQIRTELSRVLENNVVPDYLVIHATIAKRISLVERHQSAGPQIVLLREHRRNVVTLNPPTDATNGVSISYDTYAPEDESSSPFERPVKLSPQLSIFSADLPFPAEPNSSLLRVYCIVERPDLFYKAQNRRLIIFAIFLAATAIAAGAGLWTARRAFYRQLQISEMKSNFVSAVSHELRAPIASVRLMAEGLDRGKIADPARQKEYFRFIVQECRRLSSLIENVLDFSRIEQGRKRYEFEATDLVALAQQTVNVMHPYANERQVKIALKVPQDELPQPVCDGLAIQQALVNLLDNAIKHSPSGSSVTVGLQSHSGTLVSADPAPECSKDLPRSPDRRCEPTVELWVADFGPGIPPEEHEKIFERFYRRGSELRRETQGVGIGLTIVRHIAEAHGGRVRVDSAVGKGSRFTIEIPVTPHPGEDHGPGSADKME